MRDALTFHVLRITSIVTSAHMGSESIFSNQLKMGTLIAQMLRLPEIRGLKSEVRTVVL